MSPSRQTPDILKGSQPTARPSNVLGTFIVNRRKELGLTQEDFLSVITPRELSRIENGYVNNIRDDTLKSISNMLHIPFSTLRAKKLAGWLPRILVKDFTFNDGSAHREFDFVLKQRLRIIKGIRIIDKSHIKNSGNDVEDMKLYAEYALSGAVFIHKTEMNIFPELVDLANFNVIWSSQITYRLKSNPLPQIEIANAIARALRLSIGEAPKIAEFIYGGGEITKYVASGWSYIYKIPLSVTNLESAKAEFKHAIYLDSNNVYALAGLAIVHLNYVLNIWVDYNSNHAQLGEMYAISAHSKAPNVPEVQFAMGLLFRLKNDLKKSKSFFAESLRLDPSFVGSIIQIAYIDLLLGFPRSAIQRSQESSSIRSDNPGRSFAAFVEGVAQFYLRHYSASRVLLEEALDLNPNFVDPLFFLAAASLRSGYKPEARDAIRLFMERRPGITEKTLREEQPSKFLRYQRYIEEVYDALCELGLPKE